MSGVSQHLQWVDCYENPSRPDPLCLLKELALYFKDGDQEPKNKVEPVVKKYLLVLLHNTLSAFLLAARQALFVHLKASVV